MYINNGISGNISYSKRLDYIQSLENHSIFIQVTTYNFVKHSSDDKRSGYTFKLWQTTWLPWNLWASSPTQADKLQCSCCQAGFWLTQYSRYNATHKDWTPPPPLRHADIPHVLDYLIHDYVWHQHYWPSTLGTVLNTECRSGTKDYIWMALEFLYTRQSPFTATTELAGLSPQ